MAAVAITRRRPAPALLAVALVLTASAGAARAATAWAPAPFAVLIADRGAAAPPWRVRARVRDASRPRGDGVAFGVRVEEVRVGDGWSASEAIVEIDLPRDPSPQLAPGERIEIFLSPRLDRPPANFGLPRRDRLAVRGIDLRARLKSPQQIRRLAPGSTLASAVAELRRRIRGALDAHLGARSEEARALVLGERGGMEDAAMIRLARSGLVHLFAISGLHVGLVSGGAYGLARVLGISPRGATGVGLVVVSALATLVAPAPPIRRAALMAVAIGAGPLTGRRHGAPAALGLAVLALTVADPRIVHAPGFRMSALATAGLILGLRGRIDAANRPAAAVAHLSAWLTAAVITQLWVAPVLAGEGAPVPLAALALNLLALPLLALTLAALCATIVLAGWYPGLAASVGAAAEMMLDGLLRLATLGAEATPLTLRLSAATALAWWSLLGIASAVRGGRLRIGAIAGVVALALAASRPVEPLAGPTLQVLDVGQGDALLLRSRGETLLVDGGGYPGIDYDVGAHLVDPALRALGVRELRYAALSHAHLDHGDGLPTLIDRLRPAEIWMGITPPGDPLLARVQRAAGNAALAIPGGPARRLGECAVGAVLPPPRTRRRGARRVDNEASLVLVARCGEVDVWLTGDAGFEAEAGWSARGPRRTLLKVGHHGSASATSPAMLERLRPRHAVISVGARNAFGLPRTEVLRRLREAGIAVYRTDRDGALELRLGGRVRVRGARWSPGG